MKCHYHPDRESITNCIICGKPVCAECGLNIGGNTYCKDCIKDLIASSLTEKLAKTEENGAEALQKDISQATEPVTPKETQTLEKASTPSMEEIVETPPTSTQETVKETPTPSSKETIEKPSTSMQETIEKPSTSMQETVEKPSTSMQETVEKPSTLAPKNEVNKVKTEETPPIVSPNINRNISQKNISLEKPYYDEEHYDSEIAEQLQKSNDEDFIIPIHSEALENKYEKYLDDLYYDEPGKSELSLSEQLARDEAQHGSLTKKEYVPPRDKTETNVEKERSDSKIGALNNIHYNKKPKKEGYSPVDIILTIILIILIIVVIFYILYLFLLSAKYPTFIDALFGLTNPSLFFNNLIN